MTYGVIIDRSRFSERYNLEQAIQSVRGMRERDVDGLHEYQLGESHRSGCWFVIDKEGEPVDC